MALEQSRQRAMDAERERVADMQRRQREQEQFSAFEEMIRRQELEKERQRVLLEFATPAVPAPDTPLIPGIQGPPLVSPTAPQSPGDLSGNYRQPVTTGTPGPPTFDRSLKPGSLVSPENNSKLWTPPNVGPSGTVSQPVPLCRLHGGRASAAGRSCRGLPQLPEVSRG